jgi:uncharacterized protein YndB with AHSA1/START domain
MPTSVRHFLAAAFVGASLLGLVDLAAAEVISATDSGFEVLETVSVAAAPKDVYPHLTDIAAWWNKAHTYSGDAGNLSLDARPGGCFCERLKGGGGVQHMMVAYVAPNETLRLVGALGPLQALGAAGSMTFSLTPAGTGTNIAVRYRVGGYASDGMKKWAAPVDGVLGEQVGRLKRLIDGGDPESPAAK